MPTTSQPILNSIEPQLFVAEIKRACDFYANKLGFEVAFVHGEPPFYAQVCRDAAKINLRLIGEPVFATGIRTREHLLSASITLATTGEIHQLFLNYQSAGVSFDQPLKHQPCGATTFVISDPDENLILFAGPAAD